MGMKSVIPPARLLPGLHALRGIAALIIFVFHVAAIPNLAMPAELWMINPYFGLGVFFFFVLSAFSLLYSNEERVGRDGWGRDYMLRRLFRIGPLFFFMLCVFLGLRVWYWRMKISIAEVIVNALFAFNFIPGMHEGIVSASWIVSVEMIFYCVFPIVMLNVKSIPRALAVYVASAAVSVAGRILLERGPTGGTSYIHIAFVTNVGTFAAGILAYRVFEAMRVRGAGAGPMARIGFPSLAVAGLILILGPARGALSGPGFPMLQALSLVFALVCTWQALTPSRWTRMRFFQYVGERSYSLYLLHPILIYSYMVNGAYEGIYRMAAPYVGSYAYVFCVLATAPVLFLAAEATYRWVEVPGIQFGSRLLGRVRGSESQAASPGGSD
jgi:peptidoglycan/LPS O-acetylase OafA/YrhL